MNDENQQFDDPALKAALRRAIPATEAPQSLRARVQQMADDLDTGEPLRLPQAPLPTPHWTAGLLRGSRLAIAASILGLVGGVAIFQLVGDSPTEVATTENSDLQPVAYSLATQHAGTFENPAQPHFQAASESNLTAAGERLHRQVGQSLPLAAFANAGWRFRGLEDCHLDKWNGTHLVFMRQGQTLSVYVLPAQTAGTLADGRLYTTTAGRTPVAGAVSGRWFICLVGASADGSLKADDLGDLLRQILPNR